MTFSEFVTGFDPMMMLLFVAFIFGDILVGAAAALKDHTFSLQHVADGLKDKALPFGIVLIVLRIIVVASADTAYSTWAHVVFNTAWATIGVATLGSLALNVGKILGKDVVPPPQP